LLVPNNILVRLKQAILSKISKELNFCLDIKMKIIINIWVKIRIDFQKYTFYYCSQNFRLGNSKTVNLISGQLQAE